ncbi:class I SAM-dependent methyltransferase [Streptomyces beijiangensis]|uniref:Class I SAM-dependent methyltransferase n=1 Tax=Streptomyces beijiangensis TaxID=163361 RepID=A0A939F2P8_9ACTN|nr:class I SAM-dependent methyltransferase [Streptomyces beijiangensis]MBO0511027.1 class I SAM-dependent methyltransferase [Streptomyces beijiangensis]
MDWQKWHDRYDDPSSWVARRLVAVDARIRAVLDSSPPGPLRVVSLCAGQGRDLLGVLVDHPRRDDVRARLVELDPRNTAAAQEFARAAGLDQVEVVTGDASLVDHYSDLAPADLVLICGVFGNIRDADIERTVEACTSLCATGGTVVWTRNRLAPDRVPQICDWFESRGFERLWLSDAKETYGVGAHRFGGVQQPLTVGAQMFTFVGYDVLRK